jgi:hypothetical protein
MVWVVIPPEVSNSASSAAAEIRRDQVFVFFDMGQR